MPHPKYFSTDVMAERSIAAVPLAFQCGTTVEQGLFTTSQVQGDQESTTQAPDEVSIVTV